MLVCFSFREFITKAIIIVHLVVVRGSAELLWMPRDI
jgi:hypothetical protein